MTEKLLVKKTSYNSYKFYQLKRILSKVTRVSLFSFEVGKYPFNQEVKLAIGNCSLPGICKFLAFRHYNQLRVFPNPVLHFALEKIFCPLRCIYLIECGKGNLYTTNFSSRNLFKLVYIIQDVVCFLLCHLKSHRWYISSRVIFDTGLYLHFNFLKFCKDVFFFFGDVGISFGHSKTVSK